MSIDVRIEPEVAHLSVAGEQVRTSSLNLGGVPRGAVIVLAGPDGLSPVEAIDRMNALAQHGYESVMAEPPADRWDDDLGRELVRLLLQSTADREWTPEQVAVIGYGRGATAAMLVGSESVLGAAVSVPRVAAQIGTGQPVRELRTPWLALAGLDERADIADELSSYRRALQAVSSEHTSLVAYPGVEHCLLDSTEALVHQAAYDSWQRTVEWLNLHVVPRPTPLARAWDERQRPLQ